MPQVLTKIKKIVLVTILALSLIACNETRYSKQAFIFDLISKLGYDTNDPLKQASDLKIITEKVSGVNTYNFTSACINNYLVYDGLENSIEIENSEEYLDKENTHLYIDKLLEIVDNKEFISKSSVDFNKELINIDDYLLNGDFLETSTKLEINDLIYLKQENTYKIVDEKEGNSYHLSNPTFEDIDNLFFQETFDVNFEEAIIEEYQDEIFSNTNYQNVSFIDKNTDAGFKVKTSISGNAISAKISKNVAGAEIYLDLNVTNITPSIKCDLDFLKVNEFYFKTNFNFNTKIGIKYSKDKEVVLNPAKLDNSKLIESFIASLGPRLKDVDYKIPICTIKVPLPNIPFVSISMQLAFKINLQGKIEVVLTSKRNLGFEYKEGNFRFINDHQESINTIIQASAKALLDLGFSGDCFDKKLFNVGIDFGIGAKVKSTLHLYEDDGSITSSKHDVNYDVLAESMQDDQFQVCGDVYLHWLLNVYLNSKDTILGKFGLSKTYNILGEKNQILNNLTHIEDGHLVSKCTKGSGFKSTSINKVNVDSNKIVLNTLSKTLKPKENYSIVFNSLPSGYTINDLILSVYDEEVASLNGFTIYANKEGNTHIKIVTKDLKYEAFLNIMVIE